MGGKTADPADPARRSAIAGLVAGGTATLAAASVAGAATAAAMPCAPPADTPTWGSGLEGQRKADLGNGFYRNPIMAGDHPDPSILKDGDDYYMTFSSFEESPGLQIWHSRDLLNWSPLGPALRAIPGAVFAVDIVKHAGRYYIYIPFMRMPWSTTLEDFANIYVIHADSMHGPWSDPVDLQLHGRIDPGHVVGEDGKRYLFLSGVDRVRLGDDGLATDGPVEHVHDGWKYPDDWITEAYSLEGPKLLRHGGWFYLVTAEGGTAGPPTSHMVTVARSRSVHGPWENCPHNPIVRTRSGAEPWWSRGHATFVEGPSGDWWMVYHGYENGYRSLGRQTLLEPMEWTADGWPRALGGDLSKPLRAPLRRAGAGPHGIARSDDFTAPAFGTRWSFYSGGPQEQRRARVGGGVLRLEAKGNGPADSSPMTGLAGDRAYELEVGLELEGEARGGLLLFLSGRLFLGLGIDGTSMTTYAGGGVHHWREQVAPTRTLRLRIRNDEHIVSFWYSVDGEHWTRHGLRLEASGYNANTALPIEASSLRPALFAAGKGAVLFRDYRYRAL
jgi:xylan 1,4-beta-xylosidase